ncbi:MAG: efflux RND transporter periplasmic adaptor subunit [Pseudomonadaceae bacterium]
MRLSASALLCVAVTLAACGDGRAPQVTDTPPPFVRTAALQAGNDTLIGLSGVVRARVESPLAFQVAGRITARRADAGARVRAGEVLFELDRRDLEQALRAAEAELLAAASAFAAATADLERHRQLAARQFISAQALPRAEDGARQAEARRDAAQARLGQMRNALDYGQLRAPAAGVLVEVVGEVGQVVAAGQVVALLAHSGPREVEVYFPDALAPPASGEALLGDARLALRLRETAGAVDAASRTLRARYTLEGAASEPLLGSVVRTRFSGDSAADSFSVPLAALSERGEGPRIWLFGDGQVRSVAVRVLALDAERARVSGALREGDRVVVLGTHLLSENMPARELAR